MVAVFHTVCNIFLDGVGDKFRFRPLVVDPFQVNFVPSAVFGPEVFALAAFVMLDDLVCRVENRLSGAVVLLQPDNAGTFELLLKAQNILDGGAAEFVDALVVVADDAEVLMLLGEQAHQAVLGVVGVLILVY